MNDPDVAKLLFVADQQDVEAEVWSIVKKHPITEIRQFEEKEHPEEPISTALFEKMQDRISRPTPRE
jgi:hypothetical protein